MSTTFGIIKKTTDESGNETKKLIFEVAFRSSCGVCWLNNLDIIQDALKDDYPIEALDNTPQGIYTIGDIKRVIKNSEQI